MAGKPGRPLKPRRYYTDDAIKLRQVLDAIRQDESRPDAWRKDAIKVLKDAIKVLLEAPEPAESKT